MKVSSAKVNWYIGLGNRPDLEIEVDELPSRDGLVYQQKGSLYVAEKDKYVSFYSCEKSGIGYNGINVIINVNGNMTALIGPWSSRAGVVNANGFPHCMDVICVERKSGNRYAVAITIDLAKEVAAMAGVTLKAVDDEHSITYRIAEEKPQQITA